MSKYDPPPEHTALREFLALPPTTLLSHISRQWDDTWHVSLVRERSAWRQANGISIGGLWGDARHTDLRTAVQLASDALTAAEAARTAALTRPTEPITEITLNDFTIGDIK